MTLIRIFRSKSMNRLLVIIQLLVSSCLGQERLWSNIKSDISTFDVHADGFGNVYITGKVYGELNGQTGVGGFDFFIVKYTSNGDTVWTRVYGSDLYDDGTGITTDSSGNVYVIGFTMGGINGASSMGPPDMFVTKYTSDGEMVWITQTGSFSTDNAIAVAVDSIGNVYVAGSTSGALTAEPNYDEYDIFLMKYSSAGVLIWTIQRGGEDYDQGVSLSIDSSDNIYLGGQTCSGSIDNQPYSGSCDVILMKFTADGERMWTRMSGSSEDEHTAGVVADNLGFVYIGGFTKGALNDQSNYGAYDVFLMKYTSDGDLVWTHQYGTSRDDMGGDISTDGFGNIYLSGWSTNHQNLNSLDTGYDVFVAKYSPDGEQVWVQLISGDGGGEIWAPVSADGTGAVYVAGYTKFSTMFDGIPLSGSLNSFLSKLIDSSGANIQGSWCTTILLMDSFGDGWGEGVALRIYDNNDPTSYIDISNSDQALVETTVCLNPSLSLNVEVRFCDGCSLQEPWEMFYFISEKQGKKNPKSHVGAYNTVMSLQNEEIKSIQNAISFKDKRWTCDGSCEHKRRHLGPRDTDRVFDKTGKGWCTESRSNVDVPFYDALTKSIASYSSIKIPKALTAPQFVISNEDRNVVVLRGTLSDESKKHSSKKHGKTISAPIFCSKDVRSLPDGTYVFRIGGALSKDHIHRDTQWEFCGHRGTSDEELEFRISKGKCQTIAKRSRWQISNSLYLVDVSGTITMYLDDSMVAEAKSGLTDESLNEALLTDLESVIYAAASGSVTSLSSVSLISVTAKESMVTASFRIRMDAMKYLVSDAITHELLLSELQSQLNAETTLNAFLSEFHEKPEFGSVSRVVVSDFHYDGAAPDDPLAGREFTTSIESDDASMLDSRVFFYILTALFLSAMILLAVIPSRG